jgi:hypothetical protein
LKVGRCRERRGVAVLLKLGSVSLSAADIPPFSQKKRTMWREV